MSLPINPEYIHYAVDSGLAVIVFKGIRALARIELKVDTMWAWYTNHGSHITGYQEGDEKKHP